MRKAGYLRFSGIGLALCMGASTQAFAQSGPVVAPAPQPGPTTPPQPPAPGSAQGSARTPAPANALSEVVVTATRRATNVQNVALAVSAISGKDLNARNIVDPRQLSSLAPNLYVDQGLGNGDTHVSIRGLASTDYSLGASSPVATYIDDIYQPFQFGLGTDIYDLNRVEVLRGPQGTLFGKNTTGGALLYYSQAPTRTDGGYLQADAGGGEFTHYAFEGALNKAITDTLDVRFSFRTDNQGDYVQNLYDGKSLGHFNNDNARLQIAWRPTSSTTVNLKLFGLYDHGDGPIYIGTYLTNPCLTAIGPYFRCDANNIPTPESPNSTHTYSDVPIYEDYDSYGATLKVEQEIGRYTLTSITGVQRGDYALSTNDDGTAGDIFHSRQQSYTDQASQEVRLATPVALPLRAVFGFYASYDYIKAVQGSGSTTVDQSELGYLQDSLGVQNTFTLATFASATYDITKQFSITAGVRYSAEHKRVDDPFIIYAAAPGRTFTNSDINYYTAQSQFTYSPALGDYFEEDKANHTWERTNWDVSFNYKPTSQILTYARVGTGFRSGGYPVGISAPGTFVQLNPEFITSYELGVKSEWWNHRLRFNADTYYEDYDDLQVQTINANGPGLLLSNAASAHIKGVEAEADLIPVQGLTLSSSVGYNDAHYSNYSTLQFGNPVNLSGNQLPYAPKWTLNGSASYEYPIGDYSIIARTDWSYRTKIYFDPNDFSYVGDPARTIGNVSLSYGQRRQGWRLTGYVDNVTNTDSRAFGYYLAAGNSPVLASSIYNPKLTFGFRGSVSF